MPRAEPFVLVESGQRGIRISAVNEAAAAHGIRRGEALADARARLPALASRPAEPERDRAALLRLARWAGRYGPARNIDATPDGAGGRIRDGMWIDVTGVAHLYGGEGGLATDLVRRLAGFRLTARAGVADTLGAAHALARFGVAERRGFAIAPPGEVRAALAALPVAALRLAPADVVLLRRLGLKHIGQLYDLPRVALARRFRSREAAAAVLARLDQALGLAAEPRRALAEPPVVEVRRAWPEPIACAELVPPDPARLPAALAAGLAERGLGARALALSLHRADGTQAEAAVRTSAPLADAERMMELLAGRLEQIDAGFGVDLLVLAARATEPMVRAQEALVARGRAVPADPARLVDRLSNRLGPRRVVRLAARASHIPERAEAHAPALASTGMPGARETHPPSPCPAPVPRPALLLERPEPIGVVAEVPEGPPLRFTWRRREHRVVKAEGPERVAPEWWRLLPAPTEGDAWQTPAVAARPGRLAGSESGRATKDLGIPPTPGRRTRDYYRIEDAAGGRFWVFRDGLYGEDDPPRWFLHGLIG